MLCIALVAVFALDVADAATPCGNAECSAACDVGACDDEGEDGAPCVKHHCCHGVTASDPGVQGALLSNAHATAAPMAADAFVLSGCLDALERPPRAPTAI